jgi:small subunit ribosomal protein S9
MADETPRDDEQTTPEPPAAAEDATAPAQEAAAAQSVPVEVEAEAPAEAPQVEAEAPAEAPQVEAEAPAEAPQADAAPPADAPQADAAPPAEAPQADAAPAADEHDEPVQPRVKPEIPGADLEVDIVPEGDDPLARAEAEERAAAEAAEAEDEAADQPIAIATIDLAAHARYRATGKRKTAVARVTLKPGTGQYTINGRTLDVFFPRPTLQRNIRQPLEAVGYEERMDVVATMHGGGVSAQAGALRHGISRALLEADPNLRGELKRRGFLTRDARVKERKKAGLKKARKRPQFSKR